MRFSLVVASGIWRHAELDTCHRCMSHGNHHCPNHEWQHRPNSFERRMSLCFGQFRDLRKKSWTSIYHSKIHFITHAQKSLMNSILTFVTDPQAKVAVFVWQAVSVGSVTVCWITLNAQWLVFAFQMGIAWVWQECAHFWVAQEAWSSSLNTSLAWIFNLNIDELQKKL